jgi:ATP-dependent 26S proteasome regulatory subunit
LLLAVRGSPEVEAIRQDRALSSKETVPVVCNGKGLTLTGILNALDGFMSHDGSIILMTTNHRDVLDPALIRPGRVDFEEEFRTATESQLRRLYQRFFPNSNGDAEIWALTMEGKTMAEAQQDLLLLRQQRKTQPETYTLSERACALALAQQEK